MKKFFVFTIFALSISTHAIEKKSHRHHEAHEHGAATLNIAFEGLKGRVEFRAASHGVLGFEHEAKTQKEQQKVSDLIKVFENNISSMISFDPSASCIFSKDSISVIMENSNNDETPSNSAGKEKKADKNSKSASKKNLQAKHQGEHSNFIAEFNVECQKDLIGTTMTIDMTQFSKLKDIDVTLLAGELQKNIEIKSKATKIDLK